MLRELLDSDRVVRGPHGRRVVFLDEFPWLAGKRSDFLIAFADFWNSWASLQDDLMIIICGSATSWIIKNLFENNGSMYNRITRRLYVAPFNLHDTELMLHGLGMDWSRQTVLQAYMVFGGLPYYLDMLDRRKSLAENIDRLLLNANGPLRNEVPHLMEATLSASPLHHQVLHLLAKTKAGMHRTEITDKVHDKGDNIKRTLDDLEKCGYIRRYANPYERYRPSIYQLVDPFLLFSFRFMDENPLASWSNFEGSPSYYAWRGNAFEIACISHIAQIKHALGIAGVETACFPWASVTSKPKAQIDLVIERKDGITDLCEMKFTNGPFSTADEACRNLENKREAFLRESKTNNAVHLVLVSALGFKERVHPNGVSALVTGDDLFCF